ncbi:MAG: hypothetical protein K2M76_05075 [Muribaculaceae bacterium]|nr:hypothetical protein [Muribaculaceae bacterium]
MNLRFRPYIALTLFLISLPIGTVAQRARQLNTVTVTARRPMKEIGIQKTSFDSLALKENISLSQADILTYQSSVFVESDGRAP